MSNEETESIKKLNALSKEELETTRKGVIFLRRIFNTLGIGLMLMMFAWPGVFTILIGVIGVWISAYLAISGDFVLKNVDTILSKLKGR